ncbi:RNA methyltransferase [Petrotoga sp. HWH.PT.55.6.1]|uniref:23S rRNA (guanosine(2251)-2'-O)-methyltransferase RlmB n=1 Tax=unclassified Petrotoga TaxID=2620614 RepID=UPI000CA02B81|nr:MULTISPECIES: 23S rRNA (guanosine(2251)-2'-O)-methyltransferase RlmB [unclassified Petrotoga]MBL5981877.1 RNA methyltransferase [Petrotoga sp. 8T1HF07.NaAc.6.1]PNR87390.1 RNA methyltransferase [Petrotoga sp. 9T1HF07.CasAA.8.2]PNR93301.1 RNA methyltransferase [Petrotoga sp. HWHPT.55.6.3]RLL82713.1 RNA methyltransferase [Petrotoga sp. Shatin.DS.tank11.9.2.9.3]RLL89943.1 RNA methyltransferase [Petrotoga sp. HKA.pet.4.5]
MYIYGKNILKEIIEARYPVKHIFFSSSKTERGSLKEIVEDVANLGYSYSFSPNEVLEKMALTNKHQGIVIDMGNDFKYENLDIIEGKEKLFLVILDQIQDPHNFGAIVRTSVAAGVDAIIIPKDNAVEVTPVVIKVSSGQIFKIPIIKVTNLSNTIETLKKENVWVYGADVEGKPYYEIDWQGKICLVFGNEGNGIRKNVKNHCDELVSIPMFNNVESLNVSVSAGIILFEAKKQRIFNM